MKVLLTQRKLMDFHGTELVTMELAIALKKRGHEVAVFCPRPGDITNALASNDVRTYDQITDVPWQPDVIHAHHRLPALVALSHFVETPCVYVCHGLRPWPEKPPRHPQVKTYATTSQKLATTMAVTLRLSQGAVHVVPNFVDPVRFSRVRSPKDGAPKRAVLFGQLSFPEPEVEKLRNACRDHGIQLEMIRHNSGPIRFTPELFLPDYDICFAIGRSAVEAMACGCATIPIVPQLGGELITSENFDDWAHINFSPRHFTSAAQLDGEWLSDQLGRYDPADIARVAQRVRANNSIDHAVERFEEIYRQAMAEPACDRREVDAGLTRELNRLAVDADELWEEGLRAKAADVSVSAAVLERHSEGLSELLREHRALLNAVGSKQRMLDASNLALPTRKAIERSGLFCADWYLENNPDVVGASMDPLLHYLKFGAFEGRNPSPYFDNEAFLQAHPHLRTLRISPLEFLVQGAMEEGSGFLKNWMWRLSHGTSRRLKLLSRRKAG
ncbi:glycosyltransferase family 4 protein [uncultured Cohaesibacter sp.]|uniref:glycosyltransferase family 4 protein n=1 Tax=uncultured Cohaesibacter sp. TaxID=1002546 RepID=UPI0029C891F7|nr:glycosyltransferase family 4 protein [uncultured Cohaesibacter sp.]